MKPTRTSVSEGGEDVTPRPTDSMGEFEDCSDPLEELCRSELKEVLESARRTSTVERIGCARRSDLQRAPGENFWRPLRELLGTRRSRCA